jgi:membrane fusion protein (multidrug efflux system)
MNKLAKARFVKAFIFIAVPAVLVGIWLFNQDSGGAGSGRPSFGGPVTVVAETIVKEPLVMSIEALGTAVASESVTVTASLTETVRRVNFEDGDYVDKGTVLVELTDTEEEAQLAEARANLGDAERQLKRLRDLDQRGIAAASDVDVAQGAADAAQARLDTVLARLEDRLIRAPFSGVLGFREVSQGTLLMPGDTVTTIDDIAKIKLDFTVPERVLAMMESGRKIFAASVAWPGREFQGVVTAVGTRVDPVTRAVTVRATLPNEDRALRPGMLLTVRIVTDERDALSVPERSIVQISDSAYIYVVDDDRLAKRTNVRMGLRHDGMVEIVTGLTEGEQVVTEGVIKLRDGATVQFADEVVAAGPPDMVSGASEPADD